MSAPASRKPERRFSRSITLNVSGSVWLTVLPPGVPAHQVHHGPYVVGGVHRCLRCLRIGKSTGTTVSPAASPSCARSRSRDSSPRTVAKTR